MPTVVESEKSQSGWEVPAAKPLDEAAWSAWVAKGLAQDLRSGAARIKAVKCVSIAGFLVAAGFWSHLAPFEAAFRVVATAVALVAMSAALRGRQYAVAAGFAALALFYNPVAPVFSFSTEWQRAMVLASPVPFVASLAWPVGKIAREETQ